MSPCTFLLYFALVLTDPGQLAPPTWTLGPAPVQTSARASRHAWLTGPRGGIYYETPWGTKVYQKHRAPHP